jgi:hypothetical protein
MRFFYLLFFCLIMNGQAFAQKSFRYALGYRYGFLMNHHEDLEEVYGGINPKGIEFTWLKQTDGKKDWHQVWNFPDIGINLVYYDLQDQDLGYTILSSVFLQKYIGDRQNKLQLSFKVAPGISYSSKIFDEVENENNTFVSTKINTVMEGNLLAHYQFSEHIHAFGGISFSHYSNGGVRLPNSGINIPALTVGMIYTPHPSRIIREYRDITPIARKVTAHLMYAGSLKAVDEESNDLGYAWTLSGYGHWRLNHRSALTGGLDLFYNSTISERVDDPDASEYRLAIHGGHDLIAGPTSFLFQVGYYIYRPVEVDKAFYWRLGMKQQISSRVFAGFFLKAHMGRADVLEWGIGYIL